MQAGSRKYFTQWTIDVWKERLLFWSIVVGFITIFPIIYIPALNDTGENIADRSSAAMLI